MMIHVAPIWYYLSYLDPFLCIFLPVQKVTPSVTGLRPSARRGPQPCRVEFGSCWEDGGNEGTKGTKGTKGMLLRHLTICYDRWSKGKCRAFLGWFSPEFDHQRQRWRVWRLGWAWMSTKMIGMMTNIMRMQDVDEDVASTDKDAEELCFFECKTRPQNESHTVPKTIKKDTTTS